AIHAKALGLGSSTTMFAGNVFVRLAELVNGEVRMSLNYLELVYDMTEDNAQGEKEITLKMVAGVAGEKVSRFDNKRDIL
ncbi:recombination factor protein RarA, partial [Vibrio parahaemolyticus]